VPDEQPRSASASASEVQRLTEALTQLRRALRRGIRTTMSWESLPMAQVELLALLSERPALRSRDVAQALRLAPNTVSTLVSTMTRTGLLERRPDVEDRRAGRISLSPDGREQLWRWQSAHEDLLGGALDRLDERSRAQLVAALPALEQLVRALSALPPGPVAAQLRSGRPQCS